MKHTYGFVAAIGVFSSTAFGNGQSKKSKSEGGIKDIPSCPHYTRGSSKKRSKAASCNGDIQTVNCGDTFYNEKVFLTENLRCGLNETITLKGERSLLNCQGHTIRGASKSERNFENNPSAVDNDIIELVDGASVYNCNFINGHEAIKTSGEGCFTIEKVTTSFAQNNGINVNNNGTTIIKDFVSISSESSGIDIEISIIDPIDLRDRELYVGIKNYQSIGDHSDGICFEPQFPGKVVTELFGEIYIQGPEKEGIDVFVGHEVTIYGQFTTIGSAQGYGITIYDGSNVTFAEGSSGVVCYNEESDIFLGESEFFFNTLYPFDSTLFVGDGVELLCDTGNSSKCTASCDDFPVSKATACVD